MGNQAIVAFENDDGTFDLHHSPDGATNFQLLVPLSIAASTNDASYRDFVASLESPESRLNTEAGQEYELARKRSNWTNTRLPDKDPSTLLESDPFKISVNVERIVEHVSPRTKHLYLITDEVELYYPAWGSMGLLEWFEKTVEINAYNRNRTPHKGQVDALTAKKPDYSFSGTDFRDFSHIPTSKKGYEVFQDNFQDIGATVSEDAFIAEQSSETLETVRLIRSGWVFTVNATGDTITPPDAVSRSIYPIRVSLENRESLEEVANEMRTLNESVCDLALYIDAMSLEVSNGSLNGKQRAQAGKMFMEQLIESHTSEIEERLLPFSSL